VPKNVPIVPLIPSDNPTQSKDENSAISLKSLVIGILHVSLLHTQNPVSLADMGVQAPPSAPRNISYIFLTNFILFQYIPIVILRLVGVYYLSIRMVQRSGEAPNA
jgi:hypothetical protein